jgi:hypothetical protein
MAAMETLISRPTYGTLPVVMMGGKLVSQPLSLIHITVR